MPPEYLHKETYVCDQCPRVFITKNHLREHIKRVHSKEYNSMGRDYVDSIKCSSCDVAFSSGNIYIQHYQAKHGDFPPEYIDREKFICDQVGIPFKCSCQIPTFHEATTRILFLSASLAC